MKALIIFLLLVLSGLSAFSDDSTRTFNDLYQEGITAYRAGDYDTFVDRFEEIIKQRPDHPASLYNLACGYALKGDHKKSLAYLKKLAARGIDMGAEADSDFESLRDTDEFRKLVASLQYLREPVNNSRVAFTIPEQSLFPEGIAFDPIKKHFYLGSIYRRKIIRIAPDGSAESFVDDKQDGLLAVLGMRVDPVRRILWACCTGSGNMIDKQPGDDTLAGLFAYSLEDGRLIKKYILNDSVVHDLNDVAIYTDGRAYVTDSRTGAVFMADLIKDTLKTVIEAGIFIGSNGIDFTPDGKYLFVADYGSTLYRIKMSDLSLKEIKCPGKNSLYGIDGLYFYDGDLVAIQNGIRPHRVIRLRLNGSLDKVKKCDIIEMNHPDFAEPTTGAIAGDEFYYIANSQIQLLNSNWTELPSERLKNTVILKTDL